MVSKSLLFDDFKGKVYMRLSCWWLVCDIDGCVLSSVFIKCCCCIVGYVI